MANATLKIEGRKTPYEQGGFSTGQNISTDDEILISFQSLEIDEARLAEQKENLETLLNQLEIKAKEEIERRRRRVERLNSEVSDLKRRCEKFANWVTTQSAPE